jgi:UDP:flavonoid glycosyltransferase YjiC (YdhE family)
LPDSDLLVVDETPHPLLFPRCAAVVHHGGAGTTHTAARAGVPQVIVPHLLDQYYWAHKLRQLGLAPQSVPKFRLTPDLLAAALREVSADAAMARRAAEIGERLRRVDGPAAAIAELLPASAAA